jgi:hypothetical protein
MLLPPPLSGGGCENLAVRGFSGSYSHFFCDRGPSLILLGGYEVARPQGEVGDLQTNRCIRWRAGSATWTAAPDMIYFRTDAAAVGLNDGRVLVVGGWGGRARTEFDNDPNGSADGPLASAEILADSGWVEVAPAPFHQAHSAAGCLRTGHVVIAGGNDADEDSVASVCMYDPGADRWTTLPDMHRARSEATGCVLSSGRFVVFGGYDEDRYDSRRGFNQWMGDDFAEMWDPVAHSWTLLPAPGIRASLSPRTTCSASAVAGGAVVSWQPHGDSEAEERLGACGRAELFDEDGGCWFSLPSQHSNTCKNSGRLVSFEVTESKGGTSSGRTASV